MGTVFYQEISPIKGEIVIYRTSLGSRSPGVANCATVAGDRGEPSGESRLILVVVSMVIGARVGYAAEKVVASLSEAGAGPGQVQE